MNSNNLLTLIIQGKKVLDHAVDFIEIKDLYKIAKTRLDTSHLVDSR